MLVQEIHRRLYGTYPSDEQAAFYTSKSRGFNGTTWERDDFRATYALAISEALHRPVVIAVPRSVEQKVLLALNETTTRIFRRYRGCNATVKSLTMAIKRMRLAKHFLPEEPQIWVAVGFSGEDPTVPGWMRGKLWKKN